MKVPVSWLKDFVNIDGLSINELADKLVSCGFEVEGVIYSADSIRNVRTGKIISITKHEKSDNLWICQIDIRTKTIQIITAAKNVKAGDIVPVALDGAVLPSGKTISAGELRGVKSEGMLCSGSELNLTEDDFAGANSEGIWILPKETKIGLDINEVISNNEVILDVTITANRPDCNSILGIAREVAAITSQKITEPDFSYHEAGGNIKDILKVENLDYALCPRYMAKVVKNIKIEISPKIIRNRLKSCGLRPINNIVDITNYVLLEIGQPMHAFDLNLLQDSTIVIRKAISGEKIIALDGNEYTLPEGSLAICDSIRPVAVAGIMGGEESSVQANTVDIVFESARFARDSIRRTSRKINLRSDSSQRFEKNVDFYSQSAGLNRALNLIAKYGWGEIISGVIDATNADFTSSVIKYKAENINSILGINVPKNVIIDILNSLSLETKETSGGYIETALPPFREDIVGVNDLAEEVIRIYGYDKIKPTLLAQATAVKGGKTPEQKRLDKIKRFLVARGMYEIMNYSFTSPKAYSALNIAEEEEKAIKIANPIGIDFSVMRTTLAYSMIKSLAYNLIRGNKDFRLFEAGRRYISKSIPLTERPDEKNTLCLGACGENEDFYSFKAIIEELFDIFAINLSFEKEIKPFLHPGRSASVIADGEKIGYLGEVHPEVSESFDIAAKRLYVAELDLDYIINNAVDLKNFVPLSKYQSAERDLALIMPKDVLAASVLSAIKAQGGGILEDARIFDVYEGGQIPKGKKSVAVKLTFRHLDRTLRDEEVNAVIENVLNSLKDLGAVLR